ncbi:MAG TPA: aminotransferase class V-fold PLP-dependent enzyme, partial [Acidimicrobiales bacterium]|nr:aminotransferase class V-fold PLP-dependent enzyme [Acidimicrobiales bacterium]
PREVVLTSGATESIATAVAGAAARARDAGAVPHQVVTAVEHSAVRDAAARHGEVSVVAVDGTGRVDPDAVLAVVRPDTALVHVQWGNHEVGTTQPVAEVGAACRDRGVLVHVDAAQAVGRAHLGFAALGADLMSVSAHKLGGPPGIGALLVRRGLRLAPLLVGGDQERARRAGLENLPAAAGFGAAAAELAEPGRLDTEIAAADQLAARLRRGATALPGVRSLGHPTERLPHLVCLGLEGVEPQPVLLGLDRAGVAAHSGSSCSSEALEPSPVLAAMGVDADRSLRLSVGWSSTDADIDAALAALERVLTDLRALSGR